MCRRTPVLSIGPGGGSPRSLAPQCWRRCWLQHCASACELDHRKEIMNSRRLSSGAEKRYILVFETGEEVIAGLSAFTVEHGLNAASFTAIGAFHDARLGFFDWQTKEYQPIPIAEQVEVLSLVGNVALDQGKPKVHAHVVLGKADGSAHGGHLLEAHVRPTLEVTLVESPAALVRRFDRETGLALIDVDALAFDKQTQVGLDRSSVNGR